MTSIRIPCKQTINGSGKTIFVNFNSDMKKVFSSRIKWNRNLLILTENDPNKWTQPEIEMWTVIILV